MNSKKLLLATLVSFIVSFGFGGLTHMVILKSWYPAHNGAAGEVGRTHPMLQFIALGCLVLALIMSYLYPKGVESANKMMEGLKFGVIMGILWTLPYALIIYGSSKAFSGSQIAMNAVVQIIIQGIGGICIAYVYGSDAPVRKAA